MDPISPTGAASSIRASLQVLAADGEHDEHGEFGVGTDVTTS